MSGRLGHLYLADFDRELIVGPLVSFANQTHFCNNRVSFHYLFLSTLSIRIWHLSCKRGILKFWILMTPLGVSGPGDLCTLALSGVTMTSKVDKLKTEIERLSHEEFTELSRWLSEKDWGKWDEEIQADSAAGKLDFLMSEALDEKIKGTLNDL